MKYQLRLVVSLIVLLTCCAVVHAGDVIVDVNADVDPFGHDQMSAANLQSFVSHGNTITAMPMFNDPAGDHVSYWDNMVEQYDAAGVDCIAVWLKSNYQPATYANFVTAVNKRGDTNKIKIMPFDDNAASWCAMSNYQLNGRFDNVNYTFDVSNQALWKYVWDQNLEVFWQNVPDANRYKINGRPVYSMWSGAPAFFSNLNGYGSKLITYIRQQCMATFGFNPYIIVPQEWIPNDPSSAAPGIVDAVRPWFSVNHNTGETATFNGVELGCCIPGYHSSVTTNVIFIDPQNGSLLDNGLTNTIGSGCAATWVEGFDDYWEGATCWRAANIDPSDNVIPYTQSYYDYPNERINILRIHSNNPFPATQKYEAEGCDTVSNGVRVGNNYRNGDVSVQSTTDAGGGWNIDYGKIGETLTWQSVPFAGPSHLLLRIASAESGKFFHMVIDGTQYPSVAVPNTGGWQNWTTVDMGLYPMAVNSYHIVQLVWEENDCNVNWWAISPTSSAVCANPALSLGAGSYSTVQMVALSDATPGSTVFYTTDGTTPTHSSAIYSSPISVGFGTMSINAIAAQGEYADSPVTSATYVVADTTAPSTTATLAGTIGAAGWYTSSVGVTLSAVDNPGGTGVAFTYYTLDGGAQTAYSSPFTVSADGTHTVSYWSVDTAGNAETAHSLTLKIDATAPTLSFGTANPAPNANGWNNSPVTIPFTASDATSGVASTVPASSPLTFSSEGASQTQTVTVTDAAGNTASSASPAVGIDLTAPVTTASVAGSTVTLSATDALSGIASTYWTLDGGAQTTYSAPFSVTPTASHTVAYWSVDRAGNVEAAHTLTLAAPNPAPKLSSISPTSMYAGATSAQSLTVTGSAFVPASVVRWNGTALPTSYVSAISLTATVSTALLGSAGTATVTVATPAPGGGTSGSKTLTVKLPAITRLWFPASVYGGTSGTANVNINAPAPAGYVVTLTNSAPSAASVPATFAFPVGAVTASFAVPTVPVSAPVNATVAGTSGGATKSGTLGVKPPTFSKLSLSPTSVKGGSANAVGTVTINAPAPVGGAVFTLSSISAAATVPGSVTVAAGSTTAMFAVTSKAVSASTSATITATGLGSSKTAKLSITK